MKTWMLLPFVLILGWVMGSWLPKTELREAKRELAAAHKALRTQNVPRGGQLGGVTRILGIESPSASSAKTEPASTNVVEQAPAVASAAPEAQAGTNSVDTTPDEAARENRRNRRRDRSFTQNIEQAMEAWDARVGIARSTFVSNAGLSQTETEHFDVLVDAMNIRLAHSVEQFTAHVKEGKAVGEPEGIKLLRDLTSAMAMTYDEMDASFPESWRRDSGKGFSLTDFVDPAVALPLTELDGQVDDAFFMGGR